MIPLTFLYDEYIDRPKLSEQKNPFDYIVPPPISEVGKKKTNSPTELLYSETEKKSENLINFENLINIKFVDKKIPKFLQIEKEHK